MGAIKLKLELYHCLLQVPHTMLTDSEVDIMYALCQDKEIQKRLEKAKTKKDSTI